MAFDEAAGFGADISSRQVMVPLDDIAKLRGDALDRG